MHSKRLMRLLSIIILGFLGLASKVTFAIDPFTVLAAGNAALNLVELAGGAGKKTEGVRDVFSALGELNEELDLGGSDPDPYRIARKIEAIESMAREAGYTENEINSILSGYKDSQQNLSQGIRLLSRSIRLGKRIAIMTGLSSITGGGAAGAQAPAVSTMQGQNQEKKILADIYGQMVTANLDQKKDEIENQKAIQVQYKKLRSYVLSVAPGGNLSQFPVESSLIEKAINVYRAYYWVILSLVGAIFLGRIVFYQFSLAPAEKYADLIRDLFTCYFLMLAFPYVYTMMAECSEALSLKLSQILHVTGSQIPDILPVEKGKTFWWFRLEVFPLILYAFTHVVFNLVISCLIAIGPIVILSGTMMNFAMSIPAYFALLLFIWLWPAFWNVLGFFKNMLWVDHGGLGSVIAAFVLFLFQLLSPLVILSILKRTHAGQVASGVVGSTKRRVDSVIDKINKTSGKSSGAPSKRTESEGSTSWQQTKSKVKSAFLSPITTTRLVMARHDRRRQGIQLGGEQYQS
jgi:hypothetical protein